MLCRPSRDPAWCEGDPAEPRHSQAPQNFGEHRRGTALSNRRRRGRVVDPRMVRLLQVSRSGYYVWLDRKPSERAIRRENIEQKVAWFHGDSDEVYGAPRILADLLADGETISRKTVAKTMKRLGLVGICPKKWRTTTIVDHADAYPVDAVKRKWDTGALNQVWVGDITYLRTWEGWVYLATVIDAHSRRVIGWAIAAHMRTDLIEDALVMAMTLRGDRPPQVMFHSDYAEDGVKPRNRVDAGCLRGTAFVLSA